MSTKDTLKSYFVTGAKPTQAQFAAMIDQLPDTSLLQYTYNGLAALVVASGLIPGQQYLLTDYKTSYTQPITNTLKLAAAVEPLILTAATTTTFIPQVTSTLFPFDEIIYDFTSKYAAAPVVPTFEAKSTNIITGSGWNGSPDFGYIFLWDTTNPSAIANVADVSIGDGADSDQFIQGDNITAAFIGTLTTNTVHIKVNGVKHSFSNIDTYTEWVGNQNAIPTDSIITQGLTGVGVRMQIWDNANVEPATDNSLPTPTGGAPGTLRNGAITWRKDDNGNSAYYDHRNILLRGIQSYTQPGTSTIIVENDVVVPFSHSGGEDSPSIIITDLTGQTIYNAYTGQFNNQTIGQLDLYRSFKNLCCRQLNNKNS